MPTFRILDQFPVYLNLSGQLADGGSLKFYDSGTTTPRDVYGDPAKTVNNGSSVTIGSDGRPVVDIWGDGSYRVRLYDADDTLISEADDVEIQGGGGTAIPALETGKVLSNDGATLQWTDVREVPDPTGSSGKVLGNDGINPIWQSLPAPPNPPIVNTGTSVKIGTMLIQTGTDSAPASSAHTTTKAVTFATAFTTLLGVFITPTSTNITSVGFNAIAALAASGTTGFTAQFDINESSGSLNIINPVSFQWVAFGTVP